MTYELDHFKPKDEDLFPKLINEFYNLRWCCRICNARSAKGNNWPTPEEEAQGYGFVDLCVDDWQKHYKVLPDGQLEALTRKATYTIKVIGLNKPNHVKERLKILNAGHSLFAPPNQPPRANDVS